MGNLINIPEIFGTDVFNDMTMQQRLPAHRAALRLLLRCLVRFLVLRWQQDRL